MDILNLWKAALPQSRAFSIVAQKTLRNFFKSLNYPKTYQEYFDQSYLDLFPDKTTQLEEWEKQFNLRRFNMTEEQRRKRLADAWKMGGGQSPHDLQSTLNAHGFDVFVHDWWQPEERVTDITLGSIKSYMSEHIRMGSRVIEYPVAWNPIELLQKPFYPLVNKIAKDDFSYLASGGATSYMGGTNSYMGARSKLQEMYSRFSFGGDSSYMGGKKTYMGAYDKPEIVNPFNIPDDEKYWSSFVYIAGKEMPEPAKVPASRKDEFEELVLSIFPTRLWVGVIINFTEEQ